MRPRGFCAGVVRAVDIVELALQAYGPPVYVHHEIVHNRYVVEQLRESGAIFVEAVEEVPLGAVLVFSAHGVPPTTREEARLRELRVIDATCPLVTKVHLEALKFARENRTIILIGHRDHQEIVGTSGEAPKQTVVVDSVEAVDALEVKDSSRLAFLTQTTLSLYDTQEIVARLRERFPTIEGPASDDICYATQNRQEAVEQLAREVELILVVGSPNSSNSNRLVEVAKRSGVAAQLIDAAKDIDPKWLEGIRRVGLTAGASAPEILVEQVSEHLAGLGYTDQRDLDLIREDVRFTLPSGADHHRAGIEIRQTAGRKPYTEIDMHVVIFQGSRVSNSRGATLAVKIIRQPKNIVLLGSATSAAALRAWAGARAGSFARRRNRRSAKDRGISGRRSRRYRHLRFPTRRRTSTRQKCFRDSEIPE